MQIKTPIVRRLSRPWMVTGLSLLAAVAAQASTDVTFSIDMSSLGFTPTTVLIRGSFNGWGSPDSPALTNNGANVWSQTVTIANPAGTLEQCKFVYDGNWESIANRQFVLSATSPQVLPQTSWNVSDWPTPTNAEEVTFLVDLTQQTLTGSFTPGQTVTVSGDFESSVPGYANWDNGLPLTNNPSASGWATNIYSGTYDFSVVSFPPVYINYKFRANGGLESPASTSGGNRSAQMTNGVPGNPQVLPLVYYDDVAPNAPTNWITFQIDMSAQVLLGVFSPDVGTITVAGGFTGWGNGATLTNNPTLPDLTSNTHSAVLPIVGYTPVGVQYKFRMNGGWENDFNTPSKNRESTITSSNQVLPLVYYNNNDYFDLVHDDTAVTFTLYLPDQTVDNGGVPFQKGVDSVYINGTFFASDGTLVPAGTGSWWTWNKGLGGSQSPIVQMFEVGAGDYYTNTFVMPKGSSLYLTYKYSIDGYDDENGVGTNHMRLIRSFAPSYTLPTDRWSWSLPQPGITTPGTNGIVEVDFGYLSASKPAAGKVPLNWLGRPGVVLQNKSSLTSGSWTDNDGTDAPMSTNWPNASGSQFFRLKKK